MERFNKVRVRDDVNGMEKWVGLSELLIAAGVTVTGGPDPAAELRRELAALEGISATRLQRMDELLAQVDELTQGIENREDEIADMRRKNAELTTANAELAAMVDSLTQTVDSRGIEIKNLTAQLTRALASRDAARAIIHDVNKRTSQVQP